MQVNAIFSNVKAYDITKIDVVKGQSFSLESDAPDGVRLFSDNDPALAIEVTGNGAKVSADNLGSSELVYVDSNWNRLKVLNITVVASTEPATSLNVTAGEAIPK